MPFQPGFWYAAALCIQISSSVPSIGFPVDAQIPPVAVVGRSFNFTLSPTTFTSPLLVKYSAKRLPAWLRFEAAPRVLFGTPSIADLGSVQVELEATDPEGTVTTHVNLLVLEQSLVKSNQQRFIEQLGKHTPYSAPSTILLYPQTSFILDFGPDVFQSSDGGVGFYSATSNRAPLPAWIEFDKSAVKFFGTTPSLLTPQSSPQTFDFSILASQSKGFSEATLDFRISITNRMLAFDRPVQKFEAPAGQHLSIPPLLEGLHHDSAPVPRSDIVTISSNEPTWLDLDPKDFSLQGIVPTDINEASFSVQVTDHSRNTASTDITISVSNASDAHIQQLYLGNVHLTVGQYFEYTFGDIDTGVVADTIDVEVDLGPTSTWLNFVPMNRSIQGIVPATVADNALNISVTIRKDGRVIRAEYLTLLLVNISSGATHESPGTASATLQSMPGSSESSIPDADGGHTKSWKGSLALVISLPILAVLVLCGLVIFLRRKTRNRRNQDITDHEPMQESFRSYSSDNIIVLADSDSERGTEEWPQVPPMAPRIGPIEIRNRSATQRSWAVDNTNLSDSLDTRFSWNDMLMEVGNATEDHVAGATYGKQNVSLVGPANHNIRYSLNTATASALTRPKFPGHIERDQSNTLGSGFSGRRVSGLGHGTGVSSPAMTLPRTTLRHVPLSPLTESRAIGREVFEAASVRWQQNPNISILPITIEGCVGGTTNKCGRPPSLGAGLGYEWGEDEQKAQARDFVQSASRTASTSRSMWVDEEELMEASAAESGVWYVQGLRSASSEASSTGVVDRSSGRQWAGRRSNSDVGGISNATSMRSQQSEGSQSHSLRFI